MFDLVFSCAFMIFCFFLAGTLVVKPAKRGLAVSFIAAGLAFCVLFTANVALVFDNGSPATRISPGTYKVGCVYQAGENVNIGVEKTKKEGGERINFYRFPVKEFESEVRVNAKKLTVVRMTTGEGTSTRYKLE